MPEGHTLYPANLLLEGRRCLVVGGGPVAAAKAEGLLACLASVQVVATVVGRPVRALAAGHPAGGRGGGLAWEERPYRAGEAAGYRLVVAATDRSEVNDEVAGDADAAGAWVDRADAAAVCTFMVPAVLRRGPLVVTVATGGRSPALAAWLRGRVAEEVGPEYHTLLDLLAAERTGRAAGSLDWQKALDSDMLDLVRSGQVSKARERLQACRSSS